ncbi:YraN family protein [Bowmanella sp. JS7-9]|uniref:UPF0102 protein ACFP85_01810 n=1 Tax=Pseudobowmanella zhangzhouensis TaxID=1537679 RepID=A0ABW1XJS2_9ALTE|nr:YraN family protein [Bowmanella sp. JS7-9]TBX21235.1 hypothetical protein TK45_11695 [Bowmanella sp. JS7-9]
MPWNSPRWSRLIGQNHEKRACQFLQQQGLALVQANYQCRQGEIDLIMRQQDMLVFIEVKYRQSASHGAAAEYFHTSKRQKFERAIAHYLHQQGINPSSQAMRIDVVAMTDDNIDWLQGV